MSGQTVYAAAQDSLAAINALPPEILRIIFLYSTTPGSRMISFGNCIGFTVNRWKRKYSWIRLTHVCKHWRAIALGFPGLWNDLALPAMKRKWLTEVLGRSMSAPLDISLDIIDAKPRSRTKCLKPKQALEMVLKSRTADVRSLSLFVQCEDPSPVLELLGRKTLHPEFLDVFVLSTLSPEMLEDVQQLLGRIRTPRLRRLTVQSFALQWYAMALPQLTHLSIVDNRGCKWNSKAPSMDFKELTDTLACMKSLEELIIRLYGSFIHSESDLPTPTTSCRTALPQLRHLSIEARMLDMICLLERLDVPSLSRLCVGLNDDHQPDALQEQLLPAIVAKITPFESFLTLFLDIRNMSTVRIHAYTCALSVAFMSDYRIAQEGVPNGPRATFELYMRSSDLARNLAIESCKLLPLGDVRSLLLFGHSFDSSEWATLFAQTDNVTQLVVVSHCDADTEEADGRLSGALMRKQDASADGVGPHPFVLPHLHSLGLVAHNFARLQAGLPDVIDHLAACLRQRRGEGAGIETLHITRATNLRTSRVITLAKLTNVKRNGKVKIVR
ncbi:hypothetical protein FOMPIDRAFT_91364 [Fomitopsis schrenkii]|uniref:Uncharacterized protein n=1 Tax=Fomitopsis schrenkii TaxID=2126942 RepID=S8E0W6_FOMSC|nr:hypothetical protein FOMPIDRAFT_91364 [Fomitopsis schrenkii]